MAQNNTIVSKRPLLIFFILSFIISWILWIPLLIGHFKYGWTSWEGSAWTNIPTMLGLLGSLGPAIAAILVTYILEGKEGLKNLLKRIVMWRVKYIWWIIAFYGWWLLASIISVLFFPISASKIAAQFGFSLINIPVIIFILQMPLLIGMLGEELGWRGFALPRLLDRYHPIISSLILALPWIFWHAPLVVFQDWLGNMPILHFLLRHVLLILPLTLIFTWFFQNTKGSVLLVIVLHKAFNLTFNAFPGVIGLNEENGKLLFDTMIGALWVFAIILVFYFIKMKPSVEAQT